MRIFRNTFAFLLLVTSTWALHESDVGVVDWHKHLIGVPLSGSVSTAPVFHLVGTKSLILTATVNNVLAALHPENGSVAWRHIYEPEDQIAGFFKHKHVVASLSGPGGSTLRTFEALTGHLILEKRLHTPQKGHISEPHHLGIAIAFASESPEALDLFVLSNGHTINCLDGYTGDVRWSWSSPDQTSQVIYSKVIVTPDAIYAVGVSKSFASFTLHVTSLSPTTGQVLASNDIPSGIAEALTEVFALTHTDQPTKTAAPRVVWLEQGSIKSVGLTPTLQGKPTTIKGSEYARIVDVGLSEHGRLVATKTDGSSRILKLQADGSGVKSVWEFAKSASVKGSAESTFAGGLDKLGHPYITRVYWSYQMKQAGIDLYSGHLADGQDPMTSFFVPFDTNTHGLIDHVAMDAPYQAEMTSFRLFVTSSTGAVQLWQQGDLQWTREESLAALLVAEFVELPERVVASSRVGDGEESFYARLLRQISDAQGLPQYIVNFVKRFATGSYASATSPAAVSADSGSISRDAFGFRQVIVAATLFGKVYGIDSSNGEILWSRMLGLGWAVEVGGRVRPVKLFVTRTVSDGESPQVVLVTQRMAENSLVDTVIFHLDALTGKDATNPSDKSDIVLEGQDIVSGPLIEAYLLDHGAKIVLLLDEFLQIHLYPDTEENKEILRRVASSLYFPLRTSSSGGQRRLTGHQIVMDSTLSDKFVAYPTWTLSLPVEESIQSLIPAVRGPVASVGKVLGNRTTLYKYLNPRLFTVLTASHSVSPTVCGIYLVDSAKGSIVYRATLPSVAGNCHVQASLAENWLVYHFFDENLSGVGQTKGYRVVTVELYEGKAIDEKTKSSDMSSYSHASLDIMALEQAYVFPHAITAMTTTSTKFGISSKDLIVASRNHQIQSFQRRLLNPQRPNRKVTSEEQEEFLVPYDPMLPYDPRRVLSHNYEVANTQRIITSPALLESTSLVFAYGLDMFLTRVAPSNTFDVLNENFNKVQLVLTVSGLALAIMITKPMVRRKQLREKWYY